tara:strand:- start:1169 stop:1432 length:264 start_codon:yes stop_codon:yes gene_type:complete
MNDLNKYEDLGMKKATFSVGITYVGNKKQDDKPFKGGKAYQVAEVFASGLYADCPHCGYDKEVSDFSGIEKCESKDCGKEFYTTRGI